MQLRLGPATHKLTVCAGVESDTAPTNEAMLGFAATRVSVMTLHIELLKALLQEGVPAVGVSPCELVVCSALSASGDNGLGALLRHTEQLLSKGFVPVIHGDAVMHSERQWCIFRYRLKHCKFSCVPLTFCLVAILWLWPSRST